MFLNFDTVEAFAVKRNPFLSFPYLKENGELLSISVNSGLLIEPRALQLYTDFYNNALKFTECYPQYYRFTLGMALDLESGGMQGNQSQKLANYVNEENLVMFDTSDIRRCETLTLLASVGSLSSDNQDLLAEMVRNVERFIRNPNWYVKFNRPLFYDLTHFIFLLTSYGTKAPTLKNDAYSCLTNMAILALLDNDSDLLAEVCICMKYLGRSYPKYWDEFLITSHDDIAITYDGTIASALNPSVDEYHVYLVLNWYNATKNLPVFTHKFHSRTPSFSIPNQNQSLLSKLSDYAHQHHFNDSKKPFSLNFFQSTLGNHELSQWTKAINSSEMGLELIHRFAGFS